MVSCHGSERLNDKSQECQHCQSTISNFLLFSLQSWCKVQRVKNSTGVTNLTLWQAVLLEDRIFPFYFPSVKSCNFQSKLKQSLCYIYQDYFKIFILLGSVFSIKHFANTIMQSNIALHIINLITRIHQMEKISITVAVHTSFT